MTTLDRVVAFTHETSFRDVPDEAIRHGRRFLLDLLGVAIAGSQTELSRVIRGHAVDHFGAGRVSAPMLFDGRRVSPAGAALAGGMTIDSIDAHDGHRLTKGHTGCGLLPALLALHQAEGLDDGDDFLASLIVGYEVGTRAGIALHATAPDYHTSGAWIALGCALVGARALGLDTRRTAEAIGIAEYHGPRSQMMRVIDHPTMLKDGSGWGAMAGTSAVYLAADGFTGAPAITVTGDDAAPSWADLGAHWIIGDQYLKEFPVCRWAQPAVHATRALMAEHRLTAHDIADVDVFTFHQGARLAVRHPATTEQAQYALPFPVAATIVHGDLSPATVTAGLDDPEVARFAAALTVTEDDAYNTAFPAQRFARVAFTLADGRRVESADHEAPGDPHTPLADDDVIAKFHAYADPVVGGERASAIRAAVDGLGSGGPLAVLTELVSR
ncbi:MAG: MmgE/PrpD family protein [Actinomycetota bacterium]